MTVSSSAVPHLIIQRTGEGATDLFQNSSGTGFFIDSSTPISLDYTTFLAIKKAGSEKARFTSNGGLAFGDATSTTSLFTIVSDANEHFSIKRSSNRQNYIELGKTGGNLTRSWLIGIGTDAVGTQLRIENGNKVPLMFESGSGNTILGQNISGSFTSTGSFGRVNAITGFFEAGSKISDYVFEDSYTLRTLDEVETHISQSKHLPGIPSETNIQEWRNLSMGDRDRLLLEKIEELTLYTIQLNKRIEELEKK